MAGAEATRYGFYLRPSYAMCRAQAEMHDLLRRQYGLTVAGRFMPHATIKGFFRAEARVPELVARLDGALAGRRRFPVFNRGVVPYAREAIVPDINATPVGGRNAPLQALHEAAVAVLLPLVHPACEFTPREWLGARFHADLTLAMADVPARFFDEVLRFVREAEPIGPPSFVADTVHLVRFDSDDWSDRCWETLRWEILHAWHLA